MMAEKNGNTTPQTTETPAEKKGGGASANANPSRSRLKAAIHFFKVGQWQQHIQNIPPVKRFLVKLSRIVSLAFHEFVKDKCALWASALTYITMLSIVPFLAVGFSVTKAFQLYNKIHDRIIELVQTRMPDFVPLIEQLLSFTENVNVNTLGSIGVAAIIIAVVLMLNNIEKAFNQIWIAQRERNLIRKITDYLMLTIALPILLLVAFTLSGALELPVIREYFVKLPDFLQTLIRLGFQIVLPVLLIWAAAILLYKVMPNVQTSWKSIAIAGFVVAVVWQIAFLAYIGFQIGMQSNERRYNTGEVSYKIMSYKVDTPDPAKRFLKVEKSYMAAEEVRVSDYSDETKTIQKPVKKVVTFNRLSHQVAETIDRYKLKERDLVSLRLAPDNKNQIEDIKRAQLSIGKAFAQVPVLLVLLYMSWIIVLAGAEIAYAHQNVLTYRKDVSGVSPSFSDRQRLALLVLHTVVHNFHREQDRDPLTGQEVAERLGVPHPFIKDVLDVLEEKRFIVARETEDGTTYLPARPAEQIIVAEVLTAFRNNRRGELRFSRTGAYQYFNTLLERCEKAMVEPVQSISLASVIQNGEDKPPAPSVKKGGRKGRKPK